MGALALKPHAAQAASEPAFSDNFTGMALLDQEGKSFAFERLKGRIVLVHFVFTGCGTVCPVQTHALVEMRKRLSPRAQARLHIVSVSLDPLSDSPAVLKAYGERMGVDFSRWSMVTGRPQDVERVARNLRLFAPASPASPVSPAGSATTAPPAAQAKRPLKPDNHATRLWLIDPKGRLVQHYPGDPPDGQRLAREIDNLHTLHARAPI